MPIPIPHPLVEFLLLGPLDDRRQLQDTPILGDVWLEYAKNPTKRIDLLITPFRGKHAGKVAADIEDGLERNDGDSDNANIAYLQGLVVARLSFEELLRVVLPKTKWWISKWNQDSHSTDATPKHEMNQYIPPKLEEILQEIFKSIKEWNDQASVGREKELLPLHRFMALAGMILWAADQTSPKSKTGSATEQIQSILKKVKKKKISQLLTDLSAKMAKDPAREPLVWQVSLNRTATQALTKSIPAVKADAAKNLFKVSCKNIAWAVIDSGIDGSHAAFQDAKGTSRIQRSFNFKDFRRIVSLSNSKSSILKANVKLLMDNNDLLRPPKKPEEDLKRLGKRMLLTGDARGDKVLEGLELVGLLKKGDKIQIDLLKVPHHGSANNLDNDFFERIIADHYVFSGNGEHGNPERESLQMLLDARGADDYEIHLTYPVKEIDIERKKDWEKEQAKDKKKQQKDPKKKVRPNWSPKEHSLAALFKDHPALAKKIRIVEEDKPHLVDLLEEVKF